MSTADFSPAASKSDFSEMDNSKLLAHHWKIMFISGMGFMLPETKGKSLEELSTEAATPAERAA
jgi:hypothetical protein